VSFVSGVSAIRARTFASHACGSISLSLAVWMSVYMRAARSAPRSVGVILHWNGQGEGFADRGQGNMRIVKDDSADFDRRSSVPADTKLAAAGEQCLIGTDEDAFAIVELGGQRLSLM
jgi:hypothetical protein